jgi:hypothetical protein
VWLVHSQQEQEMPTVRLLRTTGIGGYETFNLTSAVIGAYLTINDLSGLVDGRTLFNIDPYVAGTLEIFLEGINQTGVAGYVISEDPGAGEFELSTPPLPGQVPMIVRYVAA